MYNNYQPKLKTSVFFPILFTLTLFFPFLTKAQDENLFNDPEKTKDFFDGKIYEVPNYGTVKFEFNKAATRASAESHRRDKSDDEQVELVFDVIVKRKNSKKKDKGDYQVSVMVYLEDQNEINSDPNKPYSLDFSIMRQIIYPIKDFPSFYTLFSDGELYYWDWGYKKLTFKEYKSKRLAGINVQKENKISYIKCSAISNR